MDKGKIKATHLGPSFPSNTAREAPTGVLVRASGKCIHLQLHSASRKKQEVSVWRALYTRSLITDGRDAVRLQDITW